MGKQINLERWRNTTILALALLVFDRPLSSCTSRGAMVSFGGTSLKMADFHRGTPAEHSLSDVDCAALELFDPILINAAC